MTNPCGPKVGEMQLTLVLKGIWVVGWIIFSKKNKKVHIILNNSPNGQI